ncbi:MAG: 2Fe-2S iron-sulfur cluster binding domain-containing protein, partial [Victivallales bacterium]|nr:2Fe-2S iron-sulfur cluster binding domain-containing protein [Victivallales bacterium]
MKECEVSFPKFNSAVYALPGTSLFECVTRAGILIRTPCAGAGKCGKCAVRIIKGDIPPSKECEHHFTSEQLKQGWRLACRATVEGDLEVDIPTSTLFESGVVALADSDGESDENTSFSIPMVERKVVMLVEPTLENPVSDIDNLLAALNCGDSRVALPLAREIPSVIRENNFNVVAYCTETEVLSVEPPGDPGASSANLALAVDLGTTTIALALLDADTGERLAAGGVLNPQVSFGDDVLNRVCGQSESDVKRAEMSSCVIEAINQTLERIAVERRVNTRGVHAVSIAGNTVMQSLFCGVPARWLGEIPFAPPFSGEMRLTAAEIGLNVHPNAVVSLFPVIGGFVGGDITAGLLATGFMDDGNDAVSLFVDVGTNGE